MRKEIIAAIAMIIAALATFFFAYDYWRDYKELKRADNIAYLFITASVEGDDSLFKTILPEEEQDILEYGHIAFPGNAKEMGERYIIKRFDHDFDENKLYYYVEYYSPAHDQTYADNVKLVKDRNGFWESTSITGIRETEMKKAISGHEDDGVLVHSYKEGEYVEH